MSDERPGRREWKPGDAIGPQDFGITPTDPNPIGEAMQRDLVRRADEMLAVADDDVSRAPQPGDTVHFIDYGDPAHLDATVIATHPEYAEGDIVDLRVDQPPLGVFRDIEHDEWQGDGYWHWPSPDEETTT